ncbi:hypothetical protein NLG97_g2266 [Lecanicillium saksenae]|uniref:Uncharacterized protein n=1 Tax=Lecanicillium saksenae TaxID=468837 RepID=A0ACC1R391_9HYPO|nr:hypothetical protein NLG97_g2266 [Lecanicillium saksenae]
MSSSQFLCCRWVGTGGQPFARQHSAGLFCFPSAGSTALLGARNWDDTGANHHCGPDCCFSNMTDAWNCYWYLMRLGTTLCGVPDGRDNMQMCSIGNAHVFGSVLGQRGSSSYCSDAATGLRWVLENCGHNGDQEVAGSAVAGGNGDLLMSVNTQY